MSHKFLISKLCVKKLNRDAIELVMAVIRNKPEITEMYIQVCNGLITIKRDSFRLDIPNFGTTVKGKIIVEKKEGDIHILFYEASDD